MKAFQPLLYLYSHIYTDDGEDDALLPLNFSMKHSRSYQVWEIHHAWVTNGGCSRYAPTHIHMQGPETNKMYYVKPSCLITAPNTKGDFWP